ncbi:(2Fe-2S)-binding protein [Isoptericola sp. b490]|uniref:(2Fe-2S)-binding protein n=1 Tax=Actinotalea lenta TaxID=3064654 RepID=UPI0027142296|nr:(2Fe-2S)-binding protein [Isoptericola sp. b490]MDO8119770.1 (2Fe-2S)-binding protein [Isoptericola sp. b490]
MHDAIRISADINGTAYLLDVEPTAGLLEVLRDQVGLTGAKSCCTEGECGACTVHLDGVPVMSCLVLAPEIDGHAVTTVEGLSGAGLSDLQEEFLNQGAVQCGFCIPGQVMAADALLATNPDPSQQEIRNAMSGNLCRCGGYQRIAAAVRATAARRRSL